MPKYVDISPPHPAMGIESRQAGKGPERRKGADDKKYREKFDHINWNDGSKPTPKE